jgi:hypothetical protein
VLRLVGPGGGRLLQDDVHIRAAQTQGRDSRSVLKKNRDEPRAMLGFGRLKCSWGGIVRCSSARTTLTRLAIPAAESRWPMLDLTAPRAQGVDAPPYTSFNAANSMGSPRSVPVPCVSMNVIEPGSEPATARACRRTSTWPDKPGAV